MIYSNVSHSNTFEPNQVEHFASKFRIENCETLTLEIYSPTLRQGRGMNYIKYSIAGTSLQNLIKPRHCETRWQIVSLLQVVVSGQGQLPAPVDNDHPPN